LVFVCPDESWGDVSEYRKGEKCDNCGREVSDLAMADLLVLFNVKIERVMTTMKFQKKRL
jgi:hypothetical protein